MKLFYMPGASSLADHIVLEWAQERYEAVRMNRQSIKAPDFLSLNPLGTVPVLLHEDFVLTENIAILVYLAELHPELGLLGDGTPRARADVMRWLGFLNSDVHKGFRPIFFPERFLQDTGLAPRLADTAREHVRVNLQRLAARLEGREWLTGQRSIADACLFVMLRWAVATKVPLQGLFNLSRFARDMYRDDGVHAALVMEEGLSRKRDERPNGSGVLAELEARLERGLPITLAAEVVGTVEYREGEGVALEVRRGIIDIEVTGMDAVLSWADENYRSEAAVPFENFSRYVSDGAIRLAP